MGGFRFIALRPVCRFHTGLAGRFACPTLASAGGGSWQGRTGRKYYVLHGIVTEISEGASTMTAEGAGIGDWASLLVPLERSHTQSTTDEGKGTHEFYCASA